jgi:outer membrane receptor protein involved in Fe transport
VTADSQTPQSTERTVSAGTGTPADMNDAASAFVATGQEVNERIFSRPAEALEIVPGLVITQHSGEGKANQYFLRGFNLDHGTDLAIFLDGMPMNMPTHAHGQGYSDLNMLIPELVRSVAIKKGPYFAVTSAARAMLAAMTKQMAKNRAARNHPITACITVTPPMPR